MNTELADIEQNSKVEPDNKLRLSVKEVADRFGDGAFEVRVLEQGQRGRTSVVMTSPRAFAFK